MITFPPSLSSFLAGVLAATAINLLTSAAIGGSGTSSRTLLIAAVPWIVASIAQAIMSVVTESARREADLLITPSLTLQERQEILRTIGASIRLHLIVLGSASIVFASLGGLLTLEIRQHTTHSETPSYYAIPTKTPGTSEPAPSENGR